jgi:hypothetical protein
MWAIGSGVAGGSLRTSSFSLSVSRFKPVVITSLDLRLDEFWLV